MAAPVRSGPSAAHSIGHGRVPDRRFHGEVADVARAAVAAPLKNVADWLGVSQSTATRLISGARKQGVLDG
jgi:hypothetical protein